MISIIGEESMYKELNEILIITNIYHKKYRIVLDNKNQEIIVNDELKYRSSNFENYLNDLIRIIRTWPINQKCINCETLIELTENDKTYTYYIGNEIPDNYDSFIDLLVRMI